MFRKLIYGTGLLLVVLSNTNCSKFIDKKPLDQFSDIDYWSTEDNLRAYAYGFYTMFTGYGNGSTTGDFYFSSFTDDQASPSFQRFSPTVPASDANWSFTNIRKANIMLERIPSMNISSEAKAHWSGIAKFFRAYSYFNLVKRFGDVPWINKSLDISENDEIYKPRDNRNIVMDSVLADLNFAEGSVRTNDGANVVDKDVVLALKSRICLYEGTFRKYHTEINATNADSYLKASMDASKALMDGGSYILDADYQTVYNSMDLSGDKEVIMYKQYLAGFLTHSVIGYTNSSTTMNGLTKSAIDAYPCTDGLPISISPLYQGDDTLTNTRANRDKRLLESISNFLCYQGNLVGGFSSSTGYRPSKFLQPADPNQLAPYNSTDAPLFWYSEILLNYAEAAAELDNLGKYSFAQSDLDKSVNLLRKRAGVGTLGYSGNQQVTAGGTAFVDLKKDNDVPSLVWEIRRERRIELMMDGFRFDDLIRWKKGYYMDNSLNPDIFLGAKVKSNGITKINADGYIMPYTMATQRVFVDPKNYLSPIPTGQISLYEGRGYKLQQNPGWE